MKMNGPGESEVLNQTGIFSQFNQSNDSGVYNDEELLLSEDPETIFDNIYVRITLYSLYSIVFCFCFFGNLAVVLVVTLHWKMRSITKFCLGNLAFANLCVGIFCIYQNLSTFLIDRWLFGHFMCKMYHFINSLSHTASILIMVVICVERYLAILHTFKSRQWITMTRLRVVIITVWIISAVVCSPRLYYINIIVYPVPGPPGGEKRYEMLCAPQHTRYSAHIVDMGYFIVLFLLPLLVISVLYTRIAICVWRGSGLLKNKTHRKSQFSKKEDSLTESHSSTSDSSSSPQHSCRGDSGLKMRKLSRGISSSKRARYSSSSDDAHSVGNKDLSQVTTVSTNEISKLNFTPNVVFTLDSPPIKKSQRKIISTQFSLFKKKKQKNCGRKKSVKKQNNVQIQKSGSVEDSNIDLIECVCESRDGQIKIINSSTKMSDSKEGIIEEEASQENWASPNKPAKLVRKKLGKSQSCGNNQGNSVQNGSVREKCGRPRVAVLRMLIVIVVTFAICNLPFHIRKICISYIPNYEIGSTFSNLSAPVTFLLMYLNCAINPIIYAFMSKSFRASLVDLVKCRFKKNFKKSSSRLRSSI